MKFAAFWCKSKSTVKWAAVLRLLYFCSMRFFGVNLADVIESLVEERNLDRDQVVAIVCSAVKIAHEKKYPGQEFVVVFNKKTSSIDVGSRKTVVANVTDKDHEVGLRKAVTIDPRCSNGDVIVVPFEEPVGRIEILAARQLIASQIKELEEEAIYDEYIEREGKILTGVVHKKERSGFAVTIGDQTGFLPNSGCIPEEQLRIGYSIKVVLKEVLAIARGGYQLILDRASADFVKCLLELEIPEIFEGIVEVKKIVRTAGYKTKVALVSHNKDIDPVGTCVGVGGVRIKPILKGLGLEKVDLIPWTDDVAEMVRASLKPAVIDDVEISPDGSRAIVSLGDDQRAFAIGKSGQNIALASALSDIQISLEPADGQPHVEDPFRDA
jgi:N utilization substance protein A